MLTSRSNPPSLCCKPGRPKLNAHNAQGLQAAQLAVRTCDVLQARAPALITVQASPKAFTAASWRCTPAMSCQPGRSAFSAMMHVARGLLR